MKYDIRQAYDWPIPLRAITIGLICVVVFYLGYFFDLSSLNARLKTIAQQEQDIKNQFISLANHQAEIRRELTQYPLLENSLQEAKKKLISPKELPEALNEILKIATKNELQFINFTPGIAEKENNYLKISIKAVVIGTYDQIATFISQVAHMNHIVALGDFSIARINPANTTKNEAVFTNRLTADLTLEVYEASHS